MKGVFLGAALLQMICIVVFMADIIEDIRSHSPHSWLEIAGIIALGIGAFLNIIAMRQIMARNEKVESELKAASGAFQEILNKRFDGWKLSPSERDVALLSIKGASINDIATMRQTKAGTIKAQCTAIYRKVGVSGRTELVSVIVEEIIEGVEQRAQ